MAGSTGASGGRFVNEFSYIPTKNSYSTARTSYDNSNIPGISNNGQLNHFDYKFRDEGLLDVESFANLCERRLVFELLNHPDPKAATQDLIHRVIDASRRGGNVGYIPVGKLDDILRNLGLTFSANEIKILTTGNAH
jgi:hypothetical protein